ncbi:MAG: hypothetical protein KatS3mg020_0409 [Fimbriimonadales bacterium]|nr:MAG: hypothetical protein KatS3mg020_0409 [Fimbriimonadales bacterium]
MFLESSDKHAGRYNRFVAAPQWWFDLTQYRERLQQYSDEDLLDVYFHIHPVRYQLHYLCVLRELRRRGIKPQIASRPLMGVRWDLPQWVSALGWLGRSRWGARVAFGTLSLGLAMVLTGWLLAPIWIILQLIRYLDPFTAFMLLMSMVWAWGIGVALTWKAGARGGWLLMALVGGSLSLWFFLHTQAFARILEALQQPLRGGGGWGF